MKSAFLAAIAVAAMSGCGREDLSSEKAKELADAAMTQHCALDRAACANLRFTEATTNKSGLWLVEYESATYLYGAIIDDDGSVEITRTSEK
ncbi:hypothetical protein HIV01_011575 [Lysobacter arenosi]|uniref:PepSY domain-containing protein n=1 Tax=Lysobacter arenosi TaxID=2795387 RepID=A0ABX7R7Z3_9GAMM|nr:hypothetical protein [Lysobacter arenosi]QSX73870.1 hypothetical protein HIV01_011575 [Lysobacter arenosi]